MSQYADIQVTILLRFLGNHLPSGVSRTPKLSSVHLAQPTLQRITQPHHRRCSLTEINSATSIDINPLLFTTNTSIHATLASTTDRLPPPSRSPESRGPSPESLPIAEATLSPESHTQWNSPRYLLCSPPQPEPTALSSQPPYRAASCSLKLIRSRAPLCRTSRQTPLAPHWPRPRAPAAMGVNGGAG